jgi:ribosome-binding protein aMBF1 (putative translation factor)
VVELPQANLTIKPTFLHLSMKEKDSKILKALGQLIFKIRTEKGLSQEEVSYRCDVDRAKISKIENGNANCNITTLVELAKGLDVPLMELMDF